MTNDNSTAGAVASRPMFDNLCERTVLGTLLQYPNEWHENADVLHEGLFYVSANQDIYKAMRTVTERGDTADIISVLAELTKARGQDRYAELVAELTALIQSVATSVTLRQNLERLAELDRRRRMRDIFLSGLQDIQGELSDTAEIQSRAMDRLKDITANATSDIKTLPMVAEEYTRDVIMANIKGTRLTGIATGFATLDQKGGLQPGDLVVIAADSSQGKTSLALQLASHAAGEGYTVAVYSMEMTAGQLYARMVATETGIPSSVLNSTPLTAEQLERYDAARQKLQRRAMLFDEKSTSNIDGILASIRTLANKRGVRLAVVDYLQILNVNMKNVNKEQAMGDAARRLKNLAKELGICIIVLSQLSRDRENPRPTMARLRDSGQIAEAADMVLLIYRPEVYGANFKYPGSLSGTDTSGTAMLDLCKGRNVGTARFIVGFNPAQTRFFDLAQGCLPQSVSARGRSFDDTPF